LSALRAAIVVALAAAVLAAAGWARALPRPLTQDEVDPFGETAAAVAERGPSALGERAPGSRFPGGTRYELPHTLLYTLLLSLTFTAAGPSALAARALGLGFHLAAMIVLILLARRAPLDGSYGAWRARPWLAAGLYLVLPLAVQYPLFLDLDNSILPPLLLALMLACILAAERAGPLPLASVSLMTALSLWAKETPPVLLLAAAAVWWVLTRGAVSAVVRLVPAAAAGAALFGVTWWGFCARTGVPIDAFYQWTINQRLLQDGAGPALGPGLKALWNEAQWVASWLSPAFLALAGLAALDRLARLVRARRAEALDLPLLFLIVLLLVHGLYYPGLKYLFPGVAPACLLVADLFVRRVLPLARAEAALTAAAILAIAIALLFAPDPVLPGWSFKREIFYATAVPLGAAGAALLLVAWRRPGRVILLSLAAVALGGSASQSLRQLGMDATVPSYGDYGERGAPELIAAMRASLPGTCTIVARRDFVFAVGTEAAQPGRTPVVIGLYRNEPQIPRAELGGIFADPALAAIMIDSQERRVWKEFDRDAARAAAREAGFTDERRFGDFVLLRRGSG